MFFLKQTNGISNSQILRPKVSLGRPLSHQRPTSPYHFSPVPQRICHKLPIHRQSLEISPPSQYYTQNNIVSKQKTRVPAPSAKILHNLHHQGTQNLEKLKNNLLSILQKSTLKFKQQINKQNQLMKRLEQKIEYQNQEIQTKNHIITTLTKNMKRINQEDNNKSSVESKKIEDLQIKLKILIEQIQEEQVLIREKIEGIIGKVMVYFGRMFNNSKYLLANFISQKSIKMEEINRNLEVLNHKNYKKVDSLQLYLKNLQIGVRNYQQLQIIKENCSLNNISKDTASHNSSTSSSKQKKDDLFLSDYFFHPSETDNPSFKMIEQLAKQRDKIHQLPIRVYLDGLGRLKYFESRTFIFDRKGNFSMPSTKDLQLLEQRGWVKVVAQ